MKKHKPTIAAIANEANVSPATVSRVINHRNLVNESTIQQVEDAMLRLGIAVNEKKLFFLVEKPETQHFMIKYVKGF